MSFAKMELALRKKFLGNKFFDVKCTFDGLNIYGYDYYTLEYLFKEIFVAHEYYFEAETDSPLIVDCGANIGMAVLYFKWLYPKARIMAFEPNPNTFSLLKKNVEANNLQNVELFNIGLFDKKTEIPFFIGDNLATLEGSIRSDRGGKNQMNIQTEMLSSILKDISKVDLMKMDVEGAEINIIRDLYNNKALSKIQECLIEYHHNMNSDKSELASFLQQFEESGFNYNIRANYSKPNSFQDLLVHGVNIKPSNEKTTTSKVNHLQVS